MQHPNFQNMQSTAFTPPSKFPVPAQAQDSLNNMLPVYPVPPQLQFMPPYFQQQFLPQDMQSMQHFTSLQPNQSPVILGNPNCFQNQNFVPLLTEPNPEKKEGLEDMQPVENFKKQKTDLDSERYLDLSVKREDNNTAEATNNQMTDDDSFQSGNEMNVQPINSTVDNRNVMLLSKTQIFQGTHPSAFVQPSQLPVATHEVSLQNQLPVNSTVNSRKVVLLSNPQIFQSAHPSAFLQSSQLPMSVQDEVSLQNQSLLHQLYQRRKEKIEEVQKFAEYFSKKRVEICLTQKDVINGLNNLLGKHNVYGNLHPNCLSKFENLSMSLKRMRVLKPLMEHWLESKVAPHSSLEKIKCTDHNDKRNIFTPTIHRKFLKEVSQQNANPSVEEMNKLANSLKMDEKTINACNHRRINEKELKHNGTTSSHIPCSYAVSTPITRPFTTPVALPDITPITTALNALTSNVRPRETQPIIVTTDDRVLENAFDSNSISVSEKGSMLSHHGERSCDELVERPAPNGRADPVEQMLHALFLNSCDINPNSDDTPHIPQQLQRLTSITSTSSD